MFSTERRRWIVALAAVTAGYFLAGSLALLFGIAVGQPMPVWPEAGIALAGTLLFGYRIVPGIFLGSLALDISSALYVSATPSLFKVALLATSTGIGASLQAWVGAFLVRRFTRNPMALMESRDIVGLLLLGGPVSCLVDASWSVTTLALGEVIAWPDYGFHWAGWWTRNCLGVVTFGSLVLVWSGQAPEFPRRRQLFVSAPLIAVFLLVVGASLYTQQWEQQRIERVFERRTSPLAQQLVSHFTSCIDVLYSLERFFASSVAVTRTEFNSFVSQRLAREPVIAALAWNPRVNESERAALERAARADGLGDFEIIEPDPRGTRKRAAQRSEYVPVFYLELRAGAKRSLGMDIAVDPVRRQALHLAHATGRAVATGQVPLWGAGNQPGFVIYHPVFDSETIAADDGRRRRLRGYVSMALRSRDVVDTIVESERLQDVDLRLYQVRNGSGPASLLGQGSTPVGKVASMLFRLGQVEAPALQRKVAFELVERNWIIEFTPTAAYWTAARRWQAWSVPGGGLLFTYLLGAFLLSVTGFIVKLQGVNAELEREIDERRTAQNDLSKTANIVASVDEAIVSSTWDGVITTWNKGAANIYGYSAQEIIGYPIALLYPARLRDEFSQLRARLASGETVSQWATVQVRKDRSEITVSLTLLPMRDGAGKITGIASISSDVSEQERAQAELRRQRETVAYRLHDSVMQSLAAISMRLDMAKNLFSERPQVALDQLSKIQGVLHDEQKNLRSFLAELKAAAPAKPAHAEGAMAALLALAKRLEDQWNVAIAVEVETEASWIPADILDNLAYLVQEGISNAVRHGEASSVRIKLGRMGENLVLSIVDNGRGFTVRSDEAELDGAVPRMLRGRTAALGGALNVYSSAAGARVEMTIPIRQRAGELHGDPAGSRR